MADTTSAITVTTIIFCEFAEHADFYYGLIHLAWAGGYIVGPIITLLAYDSIGYTGMFFLLACIISVGSLVPSICMIPSRLNAKEFESEYHD
jgi:MFS family permease